MGFIDDHHFVFQQQEVLRRGGQWSEAYQYRITSYPRMPTQGAPLMAGKDPGALSLGDPGL